MTKRLIEVVISVSLKAGHDAVTGYSQSATLPCLLAKRLQLGLGLWDFVCPGWASLPAQVTPPKPAPGQALSSLLHLPSEKVLKEMQKTVPVPLHHPAGRCH